MIILGINAYHPDSSACLLINGELKIALEEERLNRSKHWSGFPLLAIKACLLEENIKINDGLKIDVDINQMIEKIYIHPKSENWYKKLVIELVSKLGFDFEIEKSDLESDILI